MLLFRATIAKDSSIPLNPVTTWKPYVLGNIETYDIHCKREGMDRPVPIAEINRILADKLDQLQKSQLPQNKEEILKIAGKSVENFRILG